MKLRKFKLKEFEEIPGSYLAKYRALWECVECGCEGPHTFESKKISFKTTMKKPCPTCDPEQWKEMLKKHRAEIGKPLPND